jgi:3-hydroxyacyl-CoA dehydrogenase
MTSSTGFARCSPSSAIAAVVAFKTTAAAAAGLDTCLSIMKVLHNGLGDSKYRPCPLLQSYVDAGWVGQKAGKGVYQYDQEHQKDAKH